MQKGGLDMPPFCIYTAVVITINGLAKCANAMKIFC